MLQPIGLFVYRRCFLVLAIGLAVGLFLPFIRRNYSEWDAVYVLAASRLSAGEDVYPLESGYLYPPFMAWAAIPFALMTSTASRALWYGINIVCLLLTLRWAWKLSGGGSLDGSSPSVRERLIFWTGLAVGIRYAFDALAHHQTDLLVATAMLGSCLLLARSGTALYATSAVTGFGVAAAIKCTPLLWALFLACQRRFVAAVAVVAVAVGLNLLPNLTSAPPGGGWWLGEWVDRYITPLAGANRSPGVWGSDVLQNQSLAGAGHRWVMTQPAWTEQGFKVLDQFDAGRVRLTKLAVYGTGGALLVLAWIVLNRDRGRVHARFHHHPSPAHRHGLHFSVVFLLMVLLSPMSSKPHFVTLLLPGFCLARIAGDPRRWTARCSLTAAVIAGASSIKDLWGNEIASAALWYGSVTWSAIALLVGVMWELRRSPPEESGQVSASVRTVLEPKPVAATQADAA